MESGDVFGVVSGGGSYEIFFGWLDGLYIGFMFVKVVVWW